MKLICSIALKLGLIALLGSSGITFGCVRFQEKRAREITAEELSYALTALSSVDSSERSVGQEMLRGFGQSAIAPLLGALESLTPKVDVCPPGSNLPCTMGMLIESKSRKTARGEVIELLGDLHAVDAVPLLIKIMLLEHSMVFGFRYWGPEKKALVAIGESAVPELIASLGIARERRRSLQSVYGSEPSYTEIEVRIIDVLGEIGDSRALPILEELRKNAAGFFAADLDEALEKIAQKAVKRTGN